MTEDYKTPAGAPPDWRGLCAELTEHLALLDEPPHELVCRAQEALAQPEPEVMGPTDEELRELRYYGFTTSTGHGERVDEIGFARAVLARWGRPAPAPAEGEVAELVAWLRTTRAARLTRAADLLERQAASVPVAVSERLPGDALCWWYEPDEDDDGSGYGGNWTLLRIRGAVSYYTHWLPATALPLPQGEVEHG